MSTPSPLADQRQQEENPETLPDSSTPLSDQESGAGWNYSDGEGKKNKPKTSLFKRKSVIAGIIAGGGLGGMFGFLSLLPLKIPAVLDMITKDTSKYTRQVTEKRAERIVLRYMITRGGQAAGANAIVTGSPLADLIATMRINGFEKKLAAKGIVLEATPENATRLVYKGKDLGILQSDADLQKLIDKDALNAADIRDIVRREIPTWRWMQRAKFAKWLRIKYGIPRFGLKNSDQKTPEEKTAEMRRAQLETPTTTTLERTNQALDCITGGACPDLNDKRTPPVTSGAEPKPGGKMNDGSPDSVTGSVEASAKEAIDANVKETAKLGRVNTATVNLLSKFVDEKVARLIATKAIPIVGWFDLLATVNYVANNLASNQILVRLPAYLKSQSYGTMYGLWAGYADQIKAGKMDSNYVGILASQLDGGNGAGMEASRAFNYLNGDPTRGVALTENQKINENKPNQWGLFMNNTFNTFSKTPPYSINSAILTAYYKTIGGGGLLGWLADNVVGKVLSGVFNLITPQALRELINRNASAIVLNLLQFLGLSVDPADSGAKLMNDLHAGGTVTYNDYCKNELGCRKLSPQTAAAIDQQIGNEEQAAFASLPLTDRLFSASNPKSMVSRLALALPFDSSSVSFSNPIDTLSKSARALARLPSVSLSALATPSASAQGGYVDLYGVDPYGATSGDLAQPIAKEMNTPGGTCPVITDVNVFNVCLADKTVIESMLAGFKGDLGLYTPDPNAPQTVANTPGSAQPGVWKWPTVSLPSIAFTTCYGARPPRLPHEGLDIGGTLSELGTPIYAIADGTVVVSKSFGSTSYGEFLVVKHDNGYYSAYAHLYKRNVNVGDRVTAGQVIASMGSSGNSTGVHLHINITNKPQALNNWLAPGVTLDPLSILIKPPEIRDPKGCAAKARPL